MSEAEKLFEDALARVESKSIRAWAKSERNHPIWLRIAEKYLGKKDASCLLCIDIVSTAMGL